MNTPFNPLPSLPNITSSYIPNDDRKKPPRKLRRPRDKEKCETKPIFIKKLYDIYNSKAEVARIVGCSDPVIANGIKDD